jgi:mannose-6-phosphate isomerase
MAAALERLTPTRVYRFYRGGALIGKLRGDVERDDAFPEDWVGSVTHASNPGRDDPEEGLSRLADGRLLRDVVEANPEHWLGRAHVERFGTSTGVLVKLLDPAERLPVHAHPDRDFARRHFDSQFGKTEAWIVLGTRAPAGEVWIGLRDSVDPATYRGWIERQDTHALLDSLNHVAVRPGDVFFVPAGVPHAIGAGLLIAELQEPTDYSVVCEWTGFPIAREDADLGLGWDEAVAALDLGRHEPVRGLPQEAAAFFWADEVLEPAGRFAVLIVLDGEGELDGEVARPGDTFVVPAGADELAVSGGLRVLRCLAPRPSEAVDDRGELAEPRDRPLA